MNTLMFASVLASAACDACAHRPHARGSLRRCPRHSSTKGPVVDSVTPSQVNVPDRDDVGQVIQWGKNLGSNPAIYCAVIYFPATGECRFYDIKKVTRV